jgi:gluconolactonase
MKWLWCTAGLAALFALASLQPATGGQKQKYETFGAIHRMDPRLDKLLAKDAKVEKLDGGFVDPAKKIHKFVWTEGPVWVKNGGYLLFSDIPNNTINKWKDGEGTTKDFIKPAGYRGKERNIGKAGDEPGTNGLRLDPEGRLVACQHGDRRVARLDAKLDANTKPMRGLEAVKWTTLADKYLGKRLNSPNDLVFAKNGDLYFTDPPYGLEKGADDPARELNFQGVYRIKKSGEPELLTRDISRPNGIALSPDEKTLYVANSEAADKAVWYAFPLGADRKLGKGRVFFSAAKWSDKPGAPDGMKVDVEGNLWATGPGGVYILAPDGTLLGMIETFDRTANCAFGDSDGGTLYLAVNHNIARIRTLTKGLGF